MKKMVLIAVTMMVAMPVQASPSYDPQGTADRIMKAKDANHDSVIDAAEFEHVAVLQFHKLDTDGNGSLSGEEMYAHRYASRPDMMNKSDAVKRNIYKTIMKRYDYNKDKQISLDEKLKTVRNEFMTIDRDLDEKITRDELLSFWERKQAEMKKSQSDSNSND